MIEALDHVNLRTARLAEMVAWYEGILGLKRGPRPPFGFNGAWLYAGKHALVHLVEVAEPAPRADSLSMEHAAFRARDCASFITVVEAEGLPHKIVRLPEFPIVQVNIWDPDGNHLHIDFHASEVESA